MNFEQPGPEELRRWWANLRKALIAAWESLLQAVRAAWSWYCRYRQVLARVEWRWAQRAARMLSRHPDLVEVDGWMDRMYPGIP